MSTAIPIEFHGISEEVIHELKRGAVAKDALAKIEAEKRQALLGRAAGEHHPTDELGQPKYVIDPVVYQGWMRSHGIDFWRDRSNWEWFARHFSDCKIKVVPRCRGVGFGEGNKRFQKNYGEI
jgi:hypothetical protein